MPSNTDLETDGETAGEERPGAVASFPYDRLTVERFRAAFPRARWRDDLGAWFVPGITAERRIERWLGRELAGVLAYADEKGRDAYAFDPIESPYLEAAEDLRVRTPYSKTVIDELRAVPWASWDPELKAWRVPFRSWEDLRRRWPAVEAAALRNEPEERRRRREARRQTAEEGEAAARTAERRRHRHPVPVDALPPMDRVVMTEQGAVIVTEVTGEIAEAEIVAGRYPTVAAGDTLVWALWRSPTRAELVKAWPSRWPESEAERARGWWQPTLEQLRDERRKARSRERALATRRERGAGPDI